MEKFSQKIVSEMFGGQKLQYLSSKPKDEVKHLIKNVASEADNGL